MRDTIKNAIFLFAVFASYTILAQNQDYFIQKINNKDAYIVMAKTLSPRIKSGAGTEIVKAGKSATPGLINVLEDRNKGIIAHFILSEIWKEQWEEEICCTVLSDGTIEIVTVNGLEISIEANELKAKDSALKKNKEKWKKLWEA